MKRWVVLILLIADAVSASTNDFAYASASETNVFLGQVFNLDVIVKATAPPETPDPGLLPDFHVTLLDAGRATSETNTWLYRFALRARNDGQLQIPALSFGAVSTRPITIHARKPEQTDRMKLASVIEPSSVYVGQPVLLTTTWDSTYPFGAIKAVDFHFPVLNDPRFQLLELHEPDKEQNESTTGLPVHGTRVLASRRSYEADGVQHQTLVFSKLLIPKQGGLIEIPPATLLCATEEEKEPAGRQGRRSAFQYPAYFDNTFFDRNVTGDSWSRIYVETQPLKLEVKPLPTAGRPPLFTGMVGDYRIQAEAEPLEVRVGDPVTLTITITARDFMETIFFQPLRYQPLLINRFEIPAERSLPLREGRSKIYTQTIRPLSTDIEAVPPIQLAFFSPTSNAYVTIQSDPIPLKVSPAASTGAYGGAWTQSRLHTVNEGIRHNMEGPDLLGSRMPLLFGTQPWVAGLLLLFPPLLFGAAWFFGEKRHHIRRTAKVARAYKVFRKNTAHIVRRHSLKSEIYGDLDQMLRAYLGDRLHLNPGALSFRDAERLLHIESKVMDRLRSLFERCEAYRFTQGYDEKADAREIMHDAIDTVKAVERSLR